MKRIDLENSKKLYFSLKEVSNHFGVNESLLRFWETQFDSIKPRKTAGGTRQYTKDDIKDISSVFYLVKEKGLTLEGARHTLNSKQDEVEKKTEVIRKLENIKVELLELTKMFDEIEGVD